jgi:hypothetical protein
MSDACEILCPNACPKPLSGKPDLCRSLQGEDEETELPEYVLGAIRIQYLKVTSAVPFKHV